MNMINKLKKRNNDSIGVLGSGLMGHGIAYAAAISGFRVLMLDLPKKQAAKGLQKIYQISRNHLIASDFYLLYFYFLKNLIQMLVV